MRDSTDTGLLETGHKEREFDLDSYRSEVSDLGLTEEQEEEFLRTIHSILATFVEMGFTADVCGLIFSEFNESSGASNADDNL